MQSVRLSLVWSVLVTCLATSATGLAGSGGAEADHKNRWQIRLADGSSTETHGPDSAVAVDSLAHDLAGRVPRGSDKTAVNCVPTSSSHFKGIYARAQDDVDRSALIVPLLRQAIYDASAFLDSEARSASAGARARLNVACDGSSDIQVAAEALPISAEDADATSIIDALQAKGYSDPKAKYIVFWDECVQLCAFGGQGTIRDDDRASADNANNSGISYAIDYADLLVDGPAWPTILHEVGHNMGAVQLSAPNTSGAFHCNDGVDVMCYDDNGPSSDHSETACPLMRFDCSGDDYFSPSPIAGSYLATHWNIAAAYNSYIDHD